MDNTKLALRLSWIVAAILVLLPFHAFLTVWLSSLFGHYTILRLWKEFLFALVVLGSLYILARDKKLRQKLMKFWPARLIAIYSALLAASGVIAVATDNVASKAAWYGLLVDSRFLVFFLATWIIASKSDWLKNSWRTLLLAPAMVVAIFAILQYWFLPYDFLKHFGYSDRTIPAYETINHNLQYLRVASTLRGANPLGAYMLLPIITLAVLVLRNKNRRRDGVFFGLGLTLAVIFSFSRSAWIGGAIGLAIVCWAVMGSKITRTIASSAIVALAVLGIAVAVVLRNNSSFQNTVLHTETGSTVSQSSNEQHAEAFKTASKDIIHHPLGSGVGTAGPQSFYNQQKTKIAENYFLQLGQEAGLIAIGLFIAICVMVGRELWKRRADSLSLGLLASLAGLTFINLLSHAWTDDTLAYLWWGLAGVAIASSIINRKVLGEKN